MITVRRSGARGHGNHGWLDSRHTFSFASYHDPAFDGFSVLRVLNQDRVAPSRGFPMHPHQGFEIASWVVSGSLAHKDTTGAQAVVSAGGVQLISAGTGVAHEEFNPSTSEPVHFLQVWFHSNRPELPPHYAQATRSRDERIGRLCAILSPDGEDDSLPMRQDARMFATLLDPNRGDQVTHTLAGDRVAWVHVATGSVIADGIILEGGDGAAVADQSAMTLVPTGIGETEVLLFDMPKPRSRR